MMDNAYAVIMAGGKGERFWPLSTAESPKQMLSLTGGKPLVAMAVARLAGFVPPERILIVTGADLRAAVCAVVPEVPGGNVIGEPFGRDTAAAVALAAAAVRHRDPAGVFCILTADHIIGDIAVFQRTLRSACAAAANDDVLITIGMTPVFPSTGFGYVETEIEIGAKDGIEFFKARRFVEKPDRATAESYIAAGNYYWNSGMFIWSVASIQRALETHAPALAAMALRMEPLFGTAAFQEALAAEYGKLEKISVDYAIMEKSANILMARGSFFWDDVGSWLALENHLDGDGAGNVGSGKYESVDSSGNIVVSGYRLTALVGVKDLVVVQAEGATLVCSKERAQDVKKLVRALREKGGYEELL